METQQRTRDLYEHIPGYPQPPLIALPAPGDLTSLQKEGLKLTRLSRLLVQGAMRVTGFHAFQRKLPDNLERLLRQTNLRLPGLFAPAVNATLSLADDPRDLTPLERAATLMLAVQDFYVEVMGGRLPPDTHNGNPLEMGQYPNFFAASLTFKGKYVQVYKSAAADRVTVLINGRFFLLTIGPPAAPASVSQIVAALQAIVAAAQDPRQPAGDSPALLTSATNETQRQAFQILMQEPANVANLERLRHSLLTVCLDLDHAPATHAEAARLAHIQNPTNRWHHASLQLVVFGDSKASAICNFTTYLDGNTMMRGGAEIQKRAARRALDAETSVSAAQLPLEALRWRVPQDLIERAAADLAMIQDDQPSTFTLSGVGADACRAHGLPPVPVFVVALQLATQRLLGKQVQIDQFLAMSGYRCMDVTTAVASTPEVLACVAYLNGDDVQADQAVRLLQAAGASQTAAAREVRRQIPLFMLFTLFMRSLGRIRQVYTLAITMLTGLTLRTLRLYDNVKSYEVVLSHPAIFPEVPLIGRPGIRLPYVKYFGMHYQIHADRVALTLMPAPDLPVTNAELAAAIEQSLREIKGVCETAYTEHTPTELPEKAT
jgi:hypothetical protein